jgi:exosortase
MPTKSRAAAAAALAFAASFLVLYWPVLTKLVYDWSHDDNYSHGFLIVPAAAYFAWRRRSALAAATPGPDGWGLLVLIGSLAVLTAGTLGAELFLMRISIVGVLAGAVLFVFGRQYLRVLAFPIGLLLLMIPLPAIVFNQITFPLQLLASRCGEAALTAFQIPVLREGNVIVLANTTLQVVEACSGIRSLVSLLTLAVIYGAIAESPVFTRIALALAAIPVAVVANGLRVAGTGLAAQFFGDGAAEGFFHTFSGWLLFAVAFVMLFSIQKMLPGAPAEAEAAA